MSLFLLSPVSGGETDLKKRRRNHEYTSATNLRSISSIRGCMKSTTHETEAVAGGGKVVTYIL